MAGLHLHLRGDVVLVYSMPKVASSTIRKAIAESTNRPALHFHNMTREALEADKTWWVENSADRHLLWQWRGEYARYRVKLSPRRKWDVVNGVREPIARALSAFFHMGERAGYLNPEMSPDDIDLDELRSRFIAYYPSYDDWFRREFHPATGIDVYTQPFDWDRGYAVYENDRFRVLTIRQEDLSTKGTHAIAEFLHEDHVELPRRNTADRKFYHPLYRRFAEQVQLPEQLIESAYSSEQARHFYSPAELDRFRELWSR